MFILWTHEMENIFIEGVKKKRKVVEYKVSEVKTSVHENLHSNTNDRYRYTIQNNLAFLCISSY